MVKNNLRRQSSIPSYLISGARAVEVEETDLRWRRSSQAAITSMLPSHSAFHSDTGLMLTRSIKDQQRRKSMAQRRRSVAAVREFVTSGEVNLMKRGSTTRQLLRGMSTVDQWLCGHDEQQQVMENIKSMTASIAVKKKYRDQLLTREESTLKGLDLWKYQWKMKWLLFKNWFKNVIYQLEPWAGAFKKIEGQFGTATMTYFRFLRWLMFLNLFMTLSMFATILLPFLILKPEFKSAFSSSVNACQSEFHYQSVYLSANYTDHVKMTVNKEATFASVLDILQGTGWLENTVLFYGAYHNKTSVLPTGNIYTYDMALAYLFTVGAAFLLCFILLVKNSAKGMKQSVLMSSSGSVTLYCNKVFGAWDYCITQEKTAVLKRKNTLQELMNDLHYQRLQWKKASRTTMERAKLYLLRTVINIIVVIILGGSLYLIYYTNEQLLNAHDNTSLDDISLLMFQYLPSITITLLNVIVPIIFNKVVIAEDYMPAFNIRLTLTRIVLLRLASVGVLMLSLYNTLGKVKRSRDIAVLCDNLPTHNNYSTDPTVSPTQMSDINSTSDGDTDILCWETYVGQQIYKLVILNFIVVVVFTFVLEFPRKFIYTKFHEKVKVVKMLGQQQFDLSKSVLDLIYMQTLCWLGLFFSPIIPAMCFVKCFIFFYIKKSSLLHNCLPTQQYGSKSNSLYMMVLLLSFGLAVIPIVFMIGSIQPSQGCGPFRVYSHVGYIMFDTITDLVSSWKEAKQIFFLLSTGGFMAIAAFLLCLLMYYFWIVGQAHNNMSKMLKEQLKVDGQDKQFLLARVNEALSRDTS